MAGKKITTIQTGNVEIISTEIIQFHLGRNEFDSGLVYTDGGAGSTLYDRMPVGQIAATRKIVPLDPTAATGAENLFGFLDLGLEDELTVAAGASVNLTVCIKGRIDERRIVWPAGVTANDVIAGSTLTVKTYAQSRGFDFVTSKDVEVPTE